MCSVATAAVVSPVRPMIRQPRATPLPKPFRRAHNAPSAGPTTTAPKKISIRRLISASSIASSLDGAQQSGGAARRGALAVSEEQRRLGQFELEHTRRIIVVANQVDARVG